MRKKFWTGFAWALVACVLVAGSHASAGTVDDIKARGKLICGVSEGLEGFSAKGDDNVWRGFDVDFCRAVAVGLFGDAGKVDYVPLNAKDRFSALSDNKIDILSRNTTWTMRRDVEFALEFVGTSFFDGQGFMTRSGYGLSSALQLDGEKICVLGGTTSVARIESFFKRANLSVDVMQFDKRDAALGAYAEEKCRAYSGDRSALASQRTKLQEPDEHMLLPEVISKEPLGPVIREGDAQWADLVRWTLFLLMNADEAGWSSTSGDDVAKGATALIPDKVRARLGVSDDWAKSVIKTVGNYGEIFERNLGSGSPLKLERGVNALWTRGGLLYAPPMR